MNGMAWIGLSTAEVELLTKALARFRSVSPSGASEIDQIAKRLDAAASLPEITIGVYGGLVQ